MSKVIRVFFVSHMVHMKMAWKSSCSRSILNFGRVRVSLLPRKLACPLNNGGWKMIFLLKWSLLGDMLILGGVIIFLGLLVGPVRTWCLLTKTKTVLVQELVNQQFGFMSIEKSNEKGKLVGWMVGWCRASYNYAGICLRWFTFMVNHH